MTRKEVWLDHWFKPGWLSELIYTEHATRPEPEPDLRSVKEAFRARNALSIVAAIDLCDEKRRSGRETIEFGSGTINVRGKNDNDPSFEAFSALQELYIGNRRRNITPLAWFGYLARHLDKVPEDALKIVDNLCGEFVRIEKAIELGDYEDVTED